jgi:hypothetical protein
MRQQVTLWTHAYTISADKCLGRAACFFEASLFALPPRPLSLAYAYKLFRVIVDHIASAIVLAMIRRTQPGYGLFIKKTEDFGDAKRRKKIEWAHMVLPHS